MGNGGRTGHAYRKLIAAVKSRPDGWMCCRCHGAIDPGLRWPHPRSWSLDHLVPLAHGGPLLDPSNAAAAHLSCNSKHGNSIKTTKQTIIETQVW